jgi:hypothetical protein
MPAGRYSFIVEQGATFERRVVYKDGNGQPVDLTNYEARMQLRPTVDSSTVYATLSSSRDADGTGLVMTPVSASVVLPRTSGSIGIFISAASSSNFTFTEAYYDLEIYSGSGASEYVVRVLEGKVKVSKNVTR